MGDRGSALTEYANKKATEITGTILLDLLTKPWLK